MRRVPQNTNIIKIDNLPKTMMHYKISDILEACI